MKNFYLKFFAIIGIFSTFCMIAFNTGIACAKNAGAEESIIEEDVNPLVAHYRSQYEALLIENAMLKKQIECDANNIALLEKAVKQPQYDINKDGVVTMSDVIILLKVIMEVE